MKAAKDSRIYSLSEDEDYTKGILKSYFNPELRITEDTEEGSDGDILPLPSIKGDAELLEILERVEQRSDKWRLHGPEIRDIYNFSLTYEFDPDLDI